MVRHADRVCLAFPMTHLLMQITGVRSETTAELAEGCRHLGTLCETCLQQRLHIPTPKSSKLVLASCKTLAANRSL